MKVIKACENDNYEIQTTGKRRVKMHINSLRKYNFPNTDGERVNMMVISGDIEVRDRCRSVQKLTGGDLSRYLNKIESAILL